EAFRLADDQRRGSDGERALAAGLDAMADAEARLVSALQTVIVERESIRTLLDLCRSLNTLSDSQRLLSQVAKMAAQLTSADRAVVAIFDRGVLIVAAAIGFADATAETGWRTVVDEVLRGGGQRVIEA